MREQFTITFSAAQGAADLWTYGEDELVEAALGIPDAQMPEIWTRAGRYFLSAETLPLQSRIYADKACAFVLIVHLEGALRPLAQERRRARSKMPEPLKNAPPWDHSKDHLLP